MRITAWQLLADTGTLVMLSSAEEARMISLLPPLHLAVVPRDRILTGLDGLFTVLPNPGDKTSSMVLITGPSRTTDIEMILIRGVHGPDKGGNTHRSSWSFSRPDRQNGRGTSMP